MEFFRKSFWLKEKYKPRENLKENIETDVIIIGGGITGVSTAYHLSKTDTDFVLLEKNVIGCESTGKSAGVFSAGNEADFIDTIQKLGEKRAKVLWDATVKAVHDMKSEVKSNNIDCDFYDASGFYVAKKESHIKMLKREYELTNKHGFKTSFLTRLELKELINLGDKIHAAVKYDHESLANPVKLVRGLASSIKSQKGRIYEDTEAKSIGIKSDGTFVVSTSGGTVTGKRLILATETLTSTLGFLKDIVHPVNVHMVVTERLDKALMDEIKMSCDKVIWYTEVIYNLIRTTSDGRLLIDGGDVFVYKGSDYTNQKIIGNLHKQLTEFFPQLKNVKVIYGWSGNLGFTAHRLPIIGPDPKNSNLIFSAGYGGHGLTLGYLGGKISSDICTNSLSDTSKELLEIFKPPRKASIVSAMGKRLIKPYITLLKLGYHLS